MPISNKLPISADEHRYAKQLKLKRAEVVGIIEEWRKDATGAAFAKDRVNELLAMMDEHYSQLIQESWRTLNEINEEIDANGINHQYLGQRTAAIKAIAEIEGKRIDTLQKAGLLEAADLGDEMAEMEDKQNQLIGILREVSSQCTKCGPEVAYRLSKITNTAVPVEYEVVADE
jgi:hypothetical protein